MTATAGDAQRQQEALGEQGYPHRWRILAVLASVAFMAQLDLFIVNIAVPAIGRSFGGAAPVRPVVGTQRLRDRLRRAAGAGRAARGPLRAAPVPARGRRHLRPGLGRVRMSPSLGVLVAARAVQAVGAALIVPTSLGLLYPSFPRRQHATVVGIWAGVAAVAGSSGPPVGGLLAGFDWRWIFVINVPIGAATLIAGWRLLPEVRAEKGARLPDGLSAVLLLAAVTLLILATVQGPVWGWADPRTAALLAAALIAIGLTVARTLRHPHALIEKALFAGRPFTFASIALFLFFIGFAIFLLTMALFLQGQWHYSAVARDWPSCRDRPRPRCSPSTPGGSPAGSARSAGRDRHLPHGGLRRLLDHLDRVHPSYATAILPGMLVAGASAGLTQAPLFAAAGTLPPERATTGSAVLNMARQVGSAVGVAVVVVILGPAARPTVTDFHRAWGAEVAAGVLAALAAAAAGRRRRAG